MPNDDTTTDVANTEESSSQPYIYPVKSLLTGRIQPSEPSTQSLGAASRALSFENFVDLTTNQDQDTDITSTSRSSHESNGSDWDADSHSPASSSSKATSVSGEGEKLLRDAEKKRSSRSSRRRSSSSKSKTNYRHFPAEMQSTTRRFTTHLQDIGEAANSPPISSPLNTVSPVIAENLEPIGPLPLPGAVVEASPVPPTAGKEELVLDVGRMDPPPDTKENPWSKLSADDLPTPFNPSEYGIVHLPPLPASPTPSSLRNNGSSQHSSSVSGRRLVNASPNPRDTRSGSSSPPNQHPLSSVGSGPSEIRLGSDSSGVNPRSQSQSLSGDSVESGELVTFRFEHAEDENGHHVVVGREGK